MLQVNKEAYQKWRDAIVAEYEIQRKALDDIALPRSNVRLLIINTEIAIQQFDRLLASNGYWLRELNRYLKQMQKYTNELKAIAKDRQNVQ
jgi:hypothetical protein